MDITWQRSTPNYGDGHILTERELFNLADVLMEEYERSARRLYIDVAIFLYQHLLASLSPYHIVRRFARSGLSKALQLRFSQLGDPGDLEESVRLYRETVRWESEVSWEGPSLSSVINLGTALKAKFDRDGQPAGITEAVEMFRKALPRATGQDPDEVWLFQNFAIVLAARFKLSGQSSDLDEAISLDRKALAFRRPSDPNRSYSNACLGNHLFLRYQQTGQRGDLDESIEQHRETVILLRQPTPLRAQALNNLALALAARSESSPMSQSVLADMYEATRLFYEVLELPHHLIEGSLCRRNLASILISQFKWTGSPVEIDTAVALNREALAVIPKGHVERLLTLSELARSLYTRDNHGNDGSDLQEGIGLYREVVKLLSPLHPYRPTALANFASYLHRQYQRTGLVAELQESIDVTRESIQISPPDDPLVCMASLNLATFLLDLAEGDPANRSQHLDSAMASFQTATSCQSASLSRRVEGARKWADRADRLRHPSALLAYETAIDLLPQLAALGVDLQSRQKMLDAGGSGLACDAAACALRDGKLDKAVELLESGRGVFWSQGLQLRSPVDKLPPSLAEKLRNVSRELEMGSFRDATRDPSMFSLDARKTMFVEKEAVRYRTLGDTFAATVKEIRELHGFSDFLRSKSMATLKAAARGGPVIILNASVSARCAAIVVMSHSDPIHIPLADFTFETAERLATLIRGVTSDPGGGRTISTDREMEGLIDLTFPHRGMRVKPIKRIDPDDVFRLVLEKVWSSVVEPIVRSLGLQRSESLPRIWWCPTGPFTFIPIHAAGIYKGQDRVEGLLDYAISSYTPTLTTLLTPPPRDTTPFNMMAVIDAETLPHTVDELRKVEAHIPDAPNRLVKLGTRDSPALLDDVVRHLSSSSIVHFACHGIQLDRVPLDSALILKGGERLTVSQIMQHPNQGASLAFLCACQTATGTLRMPDEVIHLAATLLFAGFRGAVATMWPIHDKDGPIIADAFYGEFFKSCASGLEGPDVSEAARALHVAVATLHLRDERCSFVRWLPFIHIGQ
ncbi:hypothetical protein JAAARDRAFT_182520 [Jaapia argillacea MUCL 33604]|uniref:CHAT domain-containing protein n=1 Tax=Jaapia argillacea MUCL 33604 TaxID=933084 RepID=A0A067PJV0_9AGAM|nr:hypothetical protein JAAARDRAFT_182520 [Jaapia argillacea MUCL 33604]